MGERDVSSDDRLTAVQEEQIGRLLKHGAGVRIDEIADAIGYEAPSAGAYAGLEAYLLKQIALGRARRVWNQDEEDHFYMCLG